jgi:hypothetical protein
MTPMRANISQPPPTSAALIRFSIRGLPLLELLFGPRQLLDISGRVFERDELATAWQRDRIVELARPTPLANGANPACRIEP